jgi:hypothetical protein
MRNPTRYPTYLLALMASLALGGFAVSITQSKAVFTGFALVYAACFVAWLATMIRNRS